ncbi:MAG: NAD(P)/FAD-dependent oxidoreductase [Candidatus Latescibacteria bacterium]|nr:NAD(P)/FAD-dependent oxidoreductase [Candidatus Latescibacterota bacterium]
MSTKHVIIGGGAAGMNAIETIRGVDEGASSITLISDEPAYARMALPYYISGEIPERQLMAGDERYFDRLRVHTLFGKRVTAVSPGQKRVVLNDGTAVEYDNLLIATGSSAQRLNIPGADEDGVYNLWTLDDARKTLAKLTPQAEVAFIGAGFIGFIILNALYKLGTKLHVVEVENQVLPRMLDPQGGSLVSSWLTQHGVKAYTGVGVVEIEVQRNKRKVLRLSNGKQIKADLVIIATGITTNIGFLSGSGIHTNQGILANHRLQTNYANIYAAGDVAEGPDLSTGRLAIHAIQPTVVDHGRIAGANMAGHAVDYPGSLLMNILDVCGLQCASFGLWRDDGHETLSVVNATRPIYRKLVWDHGRIVGAIFLGPADDVAMLNDMGMVKGLIQTKAELGAWKQHLKENPVDIRRPYVATKTAAKLLEMTLLGRPSAYRDYRHAQTKTWQPHGVFVGTKQA